MSIQMTAMSDLGDALIMRGLDANMTSLNRWILLMTSLIWLQAIRVPLLVICYEHRVGLQLLLAMV